ncbi:MAG TPA: putative toxin-antitoxin system toxin component, PIN family [Cyclobacteriaceae bacterium]|nr:putative toxin-antitoxin system toxin component, PIN family [Cyclobacteriaceae bacterium]
MPRQAYDLACAEGIVVFSKTTFHEFATTFTREKFERYQTLENRLTMITLVEQRAHFKEVSINVNACRDPRDNMFLELALSCDAAAIITSDPDLQSMHPFQGIPIFSPAVFLKR